MYADLPSRYGEALMIFPDALDMEFAPESLYVAGCTEPFRYGTPRVGIIGTPKASRRSVSQACNITAEIITHGGTLVSGIAYPMEREIIQTAVVPRSTPPIIGVMGTRIDKWDCREHLLDRHCLVSPFVRGQKRPANCTLIRNTTIALLSHASVIVAEDETGDTEAYGQDVLRLHRPLLIAERLLTSGQHWPERLCGMGALSFNSVSDLLAILRNGFSLPLSEDYEIPF